MSRWLWAALLILFPASTFSATAGKVYLVLGSDTAVWNVAGGVDVEQYHNHFAPDVYVLPQQNAYKVMDPAFRTQLLDSFGQPLKLTWWMLVGSVYELADNTDVPMPSLMPMYLMQKYHGAAIQQFGDEVSVHYHTFFWSDYDGDGTYYWNQARTFNECRADFDLALAQSLLEHGVFPVSFRSGWHYMDNDWQAYLNLLLPFSMHNASPIISTDNVEPLDNVYDWSKAPITFVPFHPSTTNYQIPGDGIGWNVRSIKMPSVTQSIMNQMFAQAAAGTDQVACFWAHLPETPFPSNLVTMNTYAHAAATKYPSVQFRYCTAVEAMQRWLGATDQTPPQLDISQDIQADKVNLTILSSEPIFQSQPFVAVKDICEQYRVVPCSQNGTNSWTALIPVPRPDLAKVAVAITDLAGNLATRVIRFLPDDLFLDNLDPQYAELAGNWTSTTNAAWGTNARIALLTQSDTARVRWSLPISNSGPYKIYIQTPLVTNAAGNIRFTVTGGNSNLLSLLFANPLPGRQWVYLGSPFLDQSVENALEMAVSGSNQPNTFALADVIKLSPLLPQPGFIDDIRVEPSATTANILWTTLVPATTLVEYGLDVSYGRFSATNSFPATSHVATLTGLTPGTGYYFQILSSSGETHYARQYCFTTTPLVSNVVSTFLFDVTNTWRFSTNNLDRINWQAPGYNDGAWLSGPGLLWTDTRGASASLIQPKGTQMPANPANGRPFPTYYFRTHVNLAGSPCGVTLVLSNYIDDGAVFYLNGVEIFRKNMTAAPAVISNSTLASAYSCGGDATCAVLFAVSGPVLTNLVSGDNVLAVEVHNYASSSPDITFGCALRANRSYPPAPVPHILSSSDSITIYWNDPGFTLQEASSFGPAMAGWVDVAGPVTNSPYTFNPSTNAGSRFFRLRP